MVYEIHLPLLHLLASPTVLPQRQEGTVLDCWGERLIAAAIGQIGKWPCV